MRGSYANSLPNEKEKKRPVNKAHTFTQKKKKKNRRGEFLVIDKYNIDRTVSTRMLRKPGLVLPTLPILLAHKLNSKVAPSINRVCCRLLL